MTPPHRPSDDDSPTPPGDVAELRGNVAAALGQSVAHLEVAAAAVNRLRNLGDTEYTVGHEGPDILHFITRARPDAQAALTIAQNITATDVASPTEARGPRA